MSYEILCSNKDLSIIECLFGAPWASSVPWSQPVDLGLLRDLWGIFQHLARFDSYPPNKPVDCGYPPLYEEEWSSGRVERLAKAFCLNVVLEIWNYLAKVSSHSVGFSSPKSLFPLLYRNFIILWSQFLSIIGLSSWANRVLVRKPFLLPYIAYRVLPILSSNTFSISSFTLRSLIHLEGFCVCVCEQTDKYGSNLILLHVDIEFSQQHLLKMLFFFSYGVCFWLLH